MRHDPTLGERVVEALRAGHDVAEVTVGGIRARATVSAAGPHGSELDRLEIQRQDGATRTTEQVADAIVARIDYLAEPLQQVEVEPRLQRAILRTRRDRVQRGEYTEIEVLGGDRIGVGRLRHDRDAMTSTPIATNTGHGVLRRLIDDLGDLLTTPRVDEDR